MGIVNSNRRPSTRPGLRNSLVGVVAPFDSSTFDPAEHNVADVLAFVAQYEDETERVLAAERAGKNRVTIIDALGG